MIGKQYIISNRKGYQSFPIYIQFYTFSCLQITSTKPKSEMELPKLYVTVWAQNPFVGPQMMVKCDEYMQFMSNLINIGQTHARIK